MHASTQQFRPPVLAVQTPTDSREGLQQPPPSGHISPSPRCHMPALARRPEEGLLKELRPAAPHSASSVGGAIFFQTCLGSPSVGLPSHSYIANRGTSRATCTDHVFLPPQVPHNKLHMRESERARETETERERERQRQRERERERATGLPKRLPC